MWHRVGVLTDVCARGLGFGFAYNHGGEIPVFFYDALGQSDMEHRDRLSSVAQLPDHLNPSVVFVLVITGVG